MDFIFSTLFLKKYGPYCKDQNFLPAIIGTESVPVIRDSKIVDIADFEIHNNKCKYEKPLPCIY